MSSKKTVKPGRKKEPQTVKGTRIQAGTPKTSPTKEREDDIWQNRAEVEVDEKAWQLTFEAAPHEKVTALVEKVREDIRIGKIKPLDFTKK
jgi:hypothetical protein